MRSPQQPQMTRPEEQGAAGPRRPSVIGSVIAQLGLVALVLLEADVGRHTIGQEHIDVLEPE
jgi:hypothetical protein